MITTEDPASLREAIWTQLQSALKDKKHPWRTPVLASSHTYGSAAVRTVILREVDTKNWQLVFYTDKRSAKCQQISAIPSGEVLFWDPGLQWQLRAAVSYELLTSGPRIDRLWQQIADTSAANDYLAAPPPGTPVSSPVIMTTETPHLAMIIATVHQFDWLALSRKGHQRALITADSFQWQVP